MKPLTSTDTTSNIEKVRSLTVFEKDSPTFTYSNLNKECSAAEEKARIDINTKSALKSDLKSMSSIKEFRRTPSMELKEELLRDLEKYRRCTTPNLS